MGKLSQLPQHAPNLLGEDDEFTESSNGRDPKSIVVFRLVRILATLALLFLQIYELTENGSSNVEWSILAFFVSGRQLSPSKARLISAATQTYSSALASLAIIAPSEWRMVANRQLAIITFFAFLTFFYLDAWPFATYKQVPYHGIEDPITWIRLSLLAVAGVFVSLFSPRSASRMGWSVRKIKKLFAEKYLTRSEGRRHRVAVLSSNIFVFNQPGLPCMANSEHDDRRNARNPAKINIDIFA